MLLFLAILACTPPQDSGDSAIPVDPTLDSDGDGFTDLDEEAAGTDPLDPASASAWHPEFTTRPRLLMGPDDLPRLAELRARTDTPYDILNSRLDSACARDAQDPDPTMVSNVNNGNTALACAVLHAAGEPDAGEKAATMLEAFTTSTDIGFDEVDFVDLYGSQGLEQAIRAWDLLVGAGYPAGHDPAVAAAVLHELGEFLWDYYVIDFPVWMAGWQNNHTTKLDAAFGLLGMGAYDDPRAARYVNFTAGELPRLYDRLLADDGGQAEGPNYHVYAAQSELPWLMAFDNWLGDGMLTIMSACAHSGDADCVEALTQVASPLRADPRVCGGFDGLAEMIMPSGYGPDFDDANLVSGHFGVYAALCNSPKQAWAWSWQTDAWSSQHSVDLTADSLLLWESAPAPEAPPTGPLLRESSGWAILRDRWAADGPFAMLLSESGVARSGGGHEHPDALAFLWSARGQYLLIDSGYGSYGVHGEVNDPEAHNVILVDGEGSGSNESGVPTAWQDGPFQLARASVSYEGMDWTRTLVLADEGTLVVCDHTAISDGRSHDLTLLLQGADDTLTLTDWGGEWALGEITLEAAVLAEGISSYEQRTEEHAHTYTQGTLATHHTLAANLHTASSVDWLAVAHARQSDEAALEVVGDTVGWAGGQASAAGVITVGGDSVSCR